MVSFPAPLSLQSPDFTTFKTVSDCPQNCLPPAILGIQQFWALFSSRQQCVRLLVHFPSPNSAHKTSRLHALYAFWTSSETKLWRVVSLTAATLPSLSFSGMVWRMRSDLQNLCTTQQQTATHTQDHRRGRDGSQETLTQSQHSCKRQESPTSMYYRSGERARITMRPPYKYARSQGTPSPQISVTFRTL